MTDNKELRFISLLSGLDKSYIDEAAKIGNIRLTRRIRKYPAVAAAVAAVFIVSAVTAVAAVQGYISHKKNVEHDYQFVEDSSFVSRLEQRQGQLHRTSTCV